MCVEIRSTQEEFHLATTTSHIQDDQNTNSVCCTVFVGRCMILCIISCAFIVFISELPCQSWKFYVYIFKVTPQIRRVFDKWWVEICQNTVKDKRIAWTEQSRFVCVCHVLMIKNFRHVWGYGSWFLCRIEWGFVCASSGPLCCECNIYRNRNVKCLFARMYISKKLYALVLAIFVVYIHMTQNICFILQTIICTIEIWTIYFQMV